MSEVSDAQRPHRRSARSRSRRALASASFFTRGFFAIVLPIHGGLDGTRYRRLIQRITITHGDRNRTHNRTIIMTCDVVANWGLH